MKVLDSNLIIYAAQPGYDWLRQQILSEPFAVSLITRVEVLGWQRLSSEDIRDLEVFLAAGTTLPLDEKIANHAIKLRQRKKMSLGDALIAATVLEHDYELSTRNEDDFKNIPGLRCTNPFVS